MYAIKRLKNHPALAIVEGDYNTYGKFTIESTFAFIGLIEDLTNRKVLETIPDEVYLKKNKVILIEYNTKDGVHPFRVFKSFYEAVTNLYEEYEFVNPGKAYDYAVALDTESEE